MFKRFLSLSLSIVAVLFMSSTGFDANRLNSQLSVSSAFFMPIPFEAPAELKEVAFPVMEEPTASLRSFQDESLEASMKAKILAHPVWSKLYRNKKLSLGLVDMSNEDQPRFGTLNGRHMMYAASLPKIAVLAAAQDAIERGELKETAAVKADMRLMIAKSNNAATTRMIDRVGFENIERTMTDPNYRLYDPEFGGGLWVGKRYAAGGRRYPDPMRGISHAATTEQICRYFYLLANGELVSEKSSATMMSYLVDPALHHKFVSVLDRVAPNAKVYRKSGSWSVFHADVAMVQGPERNYIMTAIVEDPDGEQIIRDLGLVLDKLARS
ncbi:serine hydrolase [Neolewinella agarilytica]|uniref:beta-lactamase n=1 Tax=Neolewinella agarilytica TaxID=478744 RepID=A0A1H9NF38_9BACT|nr:serine hydrolase [Neolewinella agarilytica]SER34491.1 beta-lactamase class A [Neolewinella agarilytica]